LLAIRDFRLAMSLEHVQVMLSTLIPNAANEAVNEYNNRNEGQKSNEAKVNVVSNFVIPILSLLIGKVVVVERLVNLWCC